MAAIETPLGNKRKFVSNSVIGIGEVDKETNKAVLKDTAGKVFALNEATKATINDYFEVVTAFNTWVAAELP